MVVIPFASREETRDVPLSPLPMPLSPWLMFSAPETHVGGPFEAEFLSLEERKAMHFVVFVVMFLSWNSHGYYCYTTRTSVRQCAGRRVLECVWFLPRKDANHSETPLKPHADGTA